jgi:hypothetical protein
MSDPVRLLCAAALALAGAPTLAAEMDVTVPSHGRALAATLNLPEGVTAPPVVLMLHGFTGQRDEFPVAGGEVGLYAHAAAALAAAGIASLRIDFAGSGESEGAWAETTFSGQLADAVAAFDYLQTLESVDPGRVGVLGYSQGGLVGAHLAAARPEAAAVVLWAPVTNPLATYTGLLGEEAVAQALVAAPDAPIAAPLSWGGETTLDAAFYHELVTTSPAGAVARYPGPLAVIVGLGETIVTPQPAAGRMLLDYHRGEGTLIEIDSDHDWDALTTFDTVDAELLPATVGWFERHFAD